MLTQQEKETILSKFPNVKLSYENIIHNKVYNCNYIFAIPDGKKCFAWFTVFNGKQSCFILEIDNRTTQNFKDMTLVKDYLPNSLFNETILYGTLFKHMDNAFFAIEDIFYNKGQDISRFDINSKINKICYLLKSRPSYNNNDNSIIFGLPVIANTNEDFAEKLKTIKYKLSSVQYLSSNRQCSVLTMPMNEYMCNKEKRIVPEDNRVVNDNRVVTNKKLERTFVTNQQSKIFLIKPDIVNDIYYLYNQYNEYIGLACIPDYKTSVMMNKLFRNIKENNDLDALEESDDEEEFENQQVDKFVFLEKSCKMSCVFNNKFKKWTPIKIIS